jgi:hypothetical protein
MNAVAKINVRPSHAATDWRQNLGATDGVYLSVDRIADIPVRELQPLWPGVLWLGKPTLVVGDPGLGKSQLALSIAATVSRGSVWPCNAGTAESGDVLLLSAEDDAADTIRPRLTAAGADLDRVHVVTATHAIGESGELCQRFLTLTEHSVALLSAMRRLPQPRLLVIDPLSAFMSGVDTHKNGEVRSALALLARAAQELRVAVLCIGHLNKGSGGKALYRAAGSLAFVAAARAAYVVERDPDDAMFRLMLPVKNNLAKDAAGFRFSISEADNGAPYVRWADEAVTEAADDVLARVIAPRDAGVDSHQREVADWLRAALADGEPHLAAELWQQAEDRGFSRRHVQGACNTLRVHKRQLGFRGAWNWQLHGCTP